MFKTRQHRQRGISLLELMLALLVIVAVLFVVSQYFRTARENLRITQAVEMVNAIAKASYTWLEGNPNFNSNLTNCSGGTSSPTLICTLVAAGLLPAQYANVATVNPWQQAVNAYGRGSDPSQLEIVMYIGLPDSCYNLLYKLQGSVDTIYCDPNSNLIIDFPSETSG